MIDTEVDICTCTNQQTEISTPKSPMSMQQQQIVLVICFQGSCQTEIDNSVKVCIRFYINHVFIETDKPVCSCI